MQETLGSVSLSILILVSNTTHRQVSSAWTSTCSWSALDSVLPGGANVSEGCATQLVARVHEVRSAACPSGNLQFIDFVVPQHIVPCGCAVLCCVSLCSGACQCRVVVAAAYACQCSIPCLYFRNKVGSCKTAVHYTGVCRSERPTGLPRRMLPSGSRRSSRVLY